MNVPLKEEAGSAARYEIEHDWGKLPAGFIWGVTNGVAIDRAQRVYVLHTANPESACRDCVVVFNRDGEFLYSWGDQFQGHAHGLTLATDAAGNETIYVVDDEKGVFKCALDGAVLQHIGRDDFQVEKGASFGPANLCLAPSGDLYVAEGYGASFIYHFDPSGHLLNRFGGWGDAVEHTRWAHGVFIAEVDGEPLLHIAVDDPSMIKRFELSGRFHSIMPREFSHPRTIAALGELWAIPEMRGRLTLIDRAKGTTERFGDSDKTMEEIFEFRQRPRSDFPAGRFVSAHDAAFFANGDLIVVEWVECGRVNKVVRRA